MLVKRKTTSVPKILCHNPRPGEAFFFLPTLFPNFRFDVFSVSKDILSTFDRIEEVVKVFV